MSLTGKTALEIQAEYVDATYQSISGTFDRSRFSVWKGVREFIDRLPKQSQMAEIGCGNGKNLVYGTKLGHTCIGVEPSSKLREICEDKKVDTMDGSCQGIPLEDSSQDAILCIAVLHHIASKEGRKEGIKEMLRCIKIGGKLLISVWTGNEKRGFGDVLIPWKSETDAVHMRYYHTFIDGELDSLVKGVEGVKIVNSYEEMENYYVEVEKCPL